MFKRIDHIAFIVKDRQHSIRFYEDNFGFKSYFEHDVPVPAIEKIVYLSLGDSVLELIHMQDAIPNSGYHFCLYTDNFDEDYSRLTNAGVQIDTPPHPTDARTPEEKGWKRAVFKGPDGESIEIRG